MKEVYGSLVKLHSPFARELVNDATVFGNHNIIIQANFPTRTFTATNPERTSAVRVHYEFQDGQYVPSIPEVIDNSHFKDGIWYPNGIPATENPPSQE